MHESRATPSRGEVGLRQRIGHLLGTAWRRALSATAARLRPLGSRLQPGTKERLRSWLGLPSAHEYLRAGSVASQVIAARSEARPRGVASGACGLNIVGYLRSELGIGESGRLCALAAQAEQLPLSLVDFSLGSANRAKDRRWSAHLSRSNPQPVNLIHVNADQLPLAYEHFGRSFFEDRYNVGVWHWELPEFPDVWRPSFDLVDELWAPTRFVRDVLAAKSPVPVVHMPHAISFERPAEPARARFGLPPGAFLFLSMYDMRSSHERKNPRAVVDAFRLAFPGARSESGAVGLVIKVMNVSSSPGDFAALREHIDAVPGIFVIDETISRENVYRLQASCDCFISLHRSEGFGLGLAESMFLGKPVIGTNWSGNVDFMNPENSCPVRFQLVRLDEDHGPYPRGQLWADPDLEHAAEFMQRLVRDSTYRDRIATEGQRTMERDHSPQLVGQRYRKRLEEIARLA